jgi:hypothetical protein
MLRGEKEMWGWEDKLPKICPTTKMAQEPNLQSMNNFL